VAKRNQRIQNEQRQLQNLVNRGYEARQAKESFEEGLSQISPNGMSNFLPLTGSEGYDKYDDRNVIVW
jgi:hypothetical protein